MTAVEKIGLTEIEKLDQDELLSRIDGLVAEGEALAQELKSRNVVTPVMPTARRFEMDDSFGGSVKCFDLFRYHDDLETHVARLCAMKENPALASEKFRFAPNPYSPENAAITLGHAIDRVKSAESAIIKARGELPPRSAAMDAIDKVTLAKAYEERYAELEKFCSDNGSDLGVLIKQYQVEPLCALSPEEKYEKFREADNPQPVAGSLATQSNPNPTSMKEDRKLNATERLLQANNVTSLQQLAEKRKAAASVEVPKTNNNGEKLSATERVKLAKQKASQ